MIKLEAAVFTTTRIETEDSIGSATGSGTGFFYLLNVSGANSVPVVVTNRHVLQGASTISFCLSISTDGGRTPLAGKYARVPVTGASELWIGHPTEDLAVFPVGPIFHALADVGFSPFFTHLTRENFTNLSNVCPVEDIFMVGYPIGLWDGENNRPIVRRGITATQAGIPFCGNNQFVIDCACFPGSSGSPVFRLEYSSIMNGKAGQQPVSLIGILWGGPQHSSTGEVKIVAVPTSVQPISVHNIPANLGYCINTAELEWFEKNFRSEYEKIGASRGVSQTRVFFKGLEKGEIGRKFDPESDEYRDPFRSI